MNSKSSIFALALLIALRASAQAPADTPSLVPTPSFVNEAGAPPSDASVSPSEPPSDAGQSASMPQTAETAVPEAYRDDRYQVTLSKNPFMLKTNVPNNPVQTFATDWDLKYLRESKGKVLAGIQNRQTQELRTISEQPDKEGFRLVKATIARNRKDSSKSFSSVEAARSFARSLLT